MSGADTGEKLAILGGAPVRTRPWPRWPRADAETERLLLDVLRSDRWTISSPYTGRKPYERRFAEALAAYCGVPYCVATASGSSALTIALEALGAGAGREVLVPGISWVAVAASVVGIGATPVLVDIEPDTLCMSVGAARAAISEHTAAVLLVHQNCSIADLGAFLALSRETGVPILEDCSQAHGAKWNDRRVGSFGRVAAFSMQQQKLLACGEGGAVITSDPALYDRLQQLRANGRRYLDDPEPGQMEIEEVGAALGQNYTLSEFHAAILCDRLQYLEHETAIREANARLLTELLGRVGGVTPLCGCRGGRGRPAYHKYSVRLDRSQFGGRSIDALSAALTAELGIAVGVLDRPLNANRLFDPRTSPRLPANARRSGAFDPSRFSLPEAARARDECLVIRHHALLGNEDDVRDIARAFAKLKRGAAQLARA